MLVCVSLHNFAHETAGAACIRHSPLPRFGAKRFAKPGRNAPRECGGVFGRHCEERQRRSNPFLRLPRDGLLRGACHRARVRATRWLAMTAPSTELTWSAGFVATT